VYDDEGRLVFGGQVVTGFSEETLHDLMRRLKAIGQEESPLAETPRELRAAHWVRPELVAEVAFTEWTSEGGLRHPPRAWPESPRLKSAAELNDRRDQHRDLGRAAASCR
jgi:ATP-dependent DNA ligase